MLQRHHHAAHHVTVETVLDDQRPTTGSVSFWPAIRMTGVRISPHVGNHFH